MFNRHHPADQRLHQLGRDRFGACSPEEIFQLEGIALQVVQFMAVFDVDRQFPSAGADEPHFAIPAEFHGRAEIRTQGRGAHAIGLIRRDRVRMRAVFAVNEFAVQGGLLPQNGPQVTALNLPGNIEDLEGVRDQA